MKLNKNKPKQPTLNELEEEKRKLYVSKENPQRLKEIIKKLDYLYYGLNFFCIFDKLK